MSHLTPSAGAASRKTAPAVCWRFSLPRGLIMRQYQATWRHFTRHQTWQFTKSLKMEVLMGKTCITKGFPLPCKKSHRFFFASQGHIQSPPRLGGQR